MKKCFKCKKPIENNEADDGLCIDCLCEADLDYSFEHMGDEE